MNDQDETISVANALNRLANGWKALNDYLDTLTPEQWTGRTDAGGWTVKDHVIHLARWEEGITALLQKQSFFGAMGVDQATRQQGIDAINAFMQQRDKHLSVAEVREIFRQRHNRLTEVVVAMQDEDLVRPYNYYAPDSDKQDEVIWYIVGDSFGHFEEHTPWIRAIADSSPTGSRGFG
jgi:hypothetical protein